MRVKVRQVGSGDRPNDIVVELNTASGPQRLVVDDTAVEANYLTVGGYPLRRDDQFVFVALPRVTLSGWLRVWVPARDVLPG